MSFLECITIFFVILICVVIYDLLQKKHAILKNFPVIGHFRYLLETVGPELRQYIVTSNIEEKPFNRDERRWIYSTSKKENDQFGFGTDNDLELSSNFIILKPAGFAYNDQSNKNWEQLLYPIPCAKILGQSRKRKKAFRPQSIVNISAMSFGSLSGPAVSALNKGAHLAGCLHSTGEGGISTYHLKGGDLVWNIGSGYFGCRDEQGNFSLARFKEAVSQYPVKAIEIKLSQGAKPGLGGVLPGSKVTPEIAQARGIPVGTTCISSPRHSAFQNVDEMLDFIELLASETGLPVGIKSAVGDLSFWQELAKQMNETNRGVDFITIDGGEGGTGAAPLVFSDHVSLPFKIGFTSVYKEFAEANLHQKIIFIGSGKLGFPESALFALSVGCDLINVAREVMMAIGCIQAQRCHTNHCPAGVATQSKWLMRGLDPELKAHRAANYLTALRKEILRVSWSCGVNHPALLKPKQIAILNGYLKSTTAKEHFNYQADWGLPSEEDQSAIKEIMDRDSI